MPRPTQIRQRGPNGRFLSSDLNVTATRSQPSIDLFAVPPEVRLAIYEFLFMNSDKCTLRRIKDLGSQRHSTATPDIKLFNNSILTTCKTIHTEVLSLFYASQTFHYSVGNGGLLAEPVMTGPYLEWVKHLSVDITITTQSYTELDAIIATQVQTIIKHCIKLSNLTLHLIPASEARLSLVMSMSLTPTLFGYGEAVKGLCALHPRLEKLSIAHFGTWHTLHDLRKAIADDHSWEEGDKCYGWPGLSLTEAQSAAVSVPQRRYTLAGSENVIHPHRECIRIFHTYRSKTEGES